MQVAITEPIVSSIPPMSLAVTRALIVISSIIAAIAQNVKLTIENSYGRFSGSFPFFQIANAGIPIAKIIGIIGIIVSPPINHDLSHTFLTNYTRKV